MPGYYPPQIAAKATAIGPLIMATAGRAYQAHVKIAFGTDAAVYPHGQNAHEFELMVQAGMPPMFTIQAATINAAQLLRHDKDLGSLAAGKIADVVAVPGNPHEDISLMKPSELRDEGRRRLQARGTRRHNRRRTLAGRSRIAPPGLARRAAAAPSPRALAASGWAVRSCRPTGAEPGGIRRVVAPRRAVVVPARAPT